jgi:hypothetical protein
VNERDERTARNESLLRSVNENIEELTEKFQVVPEDERFEFHCECGQTGCEERIRMTISEYRTVRVQQDRFAVVPGHESPDFERVVDYSERYVVVDKLPQAEPFVGADGVPRSDG